MLSFEEISRKSRKLGFYLGELQPYFKEKKRTKELVTWYMLDRDFPDAFGKSGAKIWFTNFVNSYYLQFKDKAKKKVNPHYNMDIGVALKTRMDTINLSSGNKRGPKMQSFTEKESKEIASMIL